MRAAVQIAVLFVASAVPPLPPVNSFISLEPVTRPGTTLRHCNDVTSTCPPETGDDDFIFRRVLRLALRSRKFSRTI